MSDNLKPKSFRDLKKTLKDISPTGLASLLAYIDPFMDVLFALAFIFALLKDFSDIVLSLIPYVGQILTLFISAFCAIFIFLIMLIVGSRKNKTLAKRLLLLFIGSLADAIPVISFFPIETAVVVIAYFMILKERREEAEERKKQAEQEQIEMQQIYAQVQSN